MAGQEKQHIHYGSLEEKEKVRLEGTEIGNSLASGSTAIQAAVRAGNINVAEAGSTEVMELTGTSKEAQGRQAMLLRKLEAEKRKRSLVVPTKPSEVIDMLRDHGQPITLFGEAAADRRERLREYLAMVGREGGGGRDGGEDGGGNTGKGQNRLWVFPPDGDKEGRTLQSYTGHAARLSACAFHPCGRYLGTTSWDYTWRLWDVESGQELLLQDGHYKETHAIAFQGDGALVVTGDYAGIGHVWDLRSGKSIYQLHGHTEKVLCADWSPSGYQIATGSSENVVKIWDVRRRQNIYTLPAHSALVAAVKYAPDDGEFLATASFDGKAKVWGMRDFRLLRTLEGHEGRVVGVDWTPDGRRLVSCSHDRTFKVWADSKEF
ncbi:hypothetical protein NSK_001783 [Nannochloropsis salina CCMP1776]|uniref:Pre-mRNA processing factor 4 (PRP4)-like domain-containing protein n=1 Tax=Nannochloropsis salina CCMP1776 TaxID=1027361 RepID=A0A4D9DB72_9STRA|nr:hypothetical protein NSK_001783 [Nannochloropsis salina CCMP1776]|eukprot:TFJ86695.1 hypothetical protein NSK_001783 [Nannochloropsis salina CCMP1776]